MIKTLNSDSDSSQTLTQTCQMIKRLSNLFTMLSFSFVAPFL